MENAITIHGLQKNYKDFSLQDVSFDVPTGTIVGFIGENGAGKTTTIKAALGIIRNDGGDIRVLGRTPDELRQSPSDEIGVVMDFGFFFEGMRPADISRVSASIRRRWDAEYFEAMCKRFGIPMKKPFKEFSKGMRAKLRIITALSHHPKLLILDEPTSGLDPVVRSDMLDLFLEFIQDEEHSILLSSHITSDLEKVADYIVFLHEGRVVFSLTKDEMQERYAVVKCAKSDAEAVERLGCTVGRRDSKFDAELLVSDASSVCRTFPSMLCEQASIDDIMTFFAKGEP